MTPGQFEKIMNEFRLINGQTLVLFITELIVLILVVVILCVKK